MAIVEELNVQITTDGTKEALKNIKAVDKQVKTTSDRMAKLGSQMTARVTLPILGVGAAFVKMASDAEETRSKFLAVFKSQSDSVEAWAKDFSNAVGRSTNENLKFLASIQDTLVPLGFARKNASNLSKEIVRLSTDLSSFNNLPTEQVIRDIQSALVGNSETVRKYGVVVNQAQIIQEALTLGLIKTRKDAISPLIKAQATLSLITKSTTDAQGDAIRTAGSAANQFRALKAQGEELAQSFGQLLLPTVVDIVKGASNLVKGFNSLDDSTKETIIQVAGLVAAIGPAIFIIGKAKKAIDTMSTAFKTSQGPIALVIAALGAFTVAVIGSVNAAKEFEEGQKRVLDIISKENPSLKELTEAQKIQAKAVKELNNFVEQGLPIRDELLKAQQKLAKIEQDRIALQAKQAINQSLSNKELRKNISLLFERSAAILRNANFTVGAEAVEKRLAGLRAQWANRDKKDRIAAIQLIKQRQQKEADTSSAKKAAETRNLLLTEEKQIRQQADRELTAAREAQTKQVIEAAKKRMDAIVAFEEEKERLASDFEVNEEKRRIEGLKKEAEFQKNWLELNTQSFQNWAGVANQAISGVSGLVKQFYDNQVQEEENSFAVRKRNIENNVTDEDERAKQLEALEREKQAKIGAIKRKAFESEKAAAIASSIINTAVAITKVLSTLGPFGPLAAVGIGALGAAQTALIASKPVPAFAQGGSFTTTGPTPIMVGDNAGGRERVDITPVSSFGQNAGGDPIKLTINLNSRQLYSGIFEATRNGEVRIDARAVV
jgi:hypothetical protein